MSHNQNRLIRKRIINAYLSSVVSISLVLLLIGVASLLVINAGKVSQYIKENMQVTVLMDQDVNEGAAEKTAAEIGKLPYIRGTRVVSRAQGEADLKEMLGEDFLSVFETSPVPVSVELTLHADYVHPDSLGFITARLAGFDGVDEVECQQNLVESLTSNLAKVSLILGVFILLLLFISFVLINNTVRLNVFARRFSIHTMRLVGATRAFIRAPFLRDAVFQGLASAIIAVAAMWLSVSALKSSFRELFSIFDNTALLEVSAILVVCGILICVICTFFVVNKLMSLSKNDLYY